jgi:hypothetical protein
LPLDTLVKDLAPLEYVQPEVFAPDGKVPAHVCNLVLSLALAYNDLRDVMMAHVLLTEARPLNAPDISPARGNFGGLRSAVRRIQAGVVHELLDLVRRSKAAATHPSFLALTRKLTPAGRSAWASITDVAFDQPKNDALGKALLFLRNKLAFHYDPTEIGSALQSYLAKAPDKRLFISRGNGMRHTRFYFADGAAERYLLDKAADPVVEEFLNAEGDLLDHVNQALYELVTRFVEYRGFAYRQPRPVA